MEGVSIVIVAAGRGMRMDQGDKIFIDIAGLPLIGHTWRQFDQLTETGEIIMVTRDNARPQFKELARRIGVGKPWKLVAGGEERQDSVWNGVNATDAEMSLVAIQDGARPCTPHSAIQAALAAARETGAAVLAKRVSDTLKRGDGQAQIAGTVDRENLWAVQTPQVFRREIILAALAKVREKGLLVTDDAAACEALGQAVRLIECEQPNPKATTPADLPFIESLLSG
ncbi:MAG: 2-C-methyl-D-erythritol 4-phosphate cytidylyltransferase [Verrucomicrobiota bacterium]|jgi:2-C-methyl-D-erythritol 4-phosphate cytidylyltransferase|nr:2-C-methyl-D-erythritol 4-phosphate cytidylyltransferase [Verrucomicrobiota bacterium]MDP7047813.1 2-C-methyl-D-erythritol 4-phosphate cytidylyltransferase [Verrucomicrobiota bacterium]